MKKSIRKKTTGLEIKISDIENNHYQLLNNFQLCQQGQCNCPTDEYKKLENLNIKSSATEIVLSLKAQKNKTFDDGQVEKCINFVISKSQKE